MKKIITALKIIWKTIVPKYSTKLQSSLISETKRAHVNYMELNMIKKPPSSLNAFFPFNLGWLWN